MNKGIGPVFISHSSQEPDYSVAGSLAEALAEIGIDVWWDVNRLEGGDFFPVEILEAIIRQHFFLFIVSERSLASKWCLRELIRATDLGKDVKPLILGHVPNEKAPLELAGLQGVDISTGIANSLPAILRALGLGETSPQNVLDDPFARDGRLIKGRSYVLGEGWSCTPNKASKEPFTQASRRCNRWLHPVSLQRIPTPLKRCWMSYVHALSTMPLPRGKPSSLYAA
jgi:hypothetical protein